MRRVASRGVFSRIGVRHRWAEALEPRVLLSTFTVSNAENTGDGSLRKAIADANENPGADQVVFNIPGNSVQVIRPAPTVPGDALSAAMPIRGPVVIDGYTQPGAAPNTAAVGNNAVIRVRIDGASAPAGLAGLFVDAAGGVTLRGFSITGFQDGIIVRGGTGVNKIAGNFIGLDPAGNAAPNRGLGVSIEGSPGNTVGGTAPADRNVISSNGDVGVRLTRAASVDNYIEGNYIGTNPAGDAARPNVGAGVVVTAFSIAEGYASRTTIGGVESGAGNVISGNGQGIVLLGPTSQFNAVLGNKIGTNAAGTAAVGNSFHGILVTFPSVGVNSSSNNTIGGIVPAARNIISGNGRAGINLFGPGANGNTVQGNYIGTDVTGSYAISNQNDGIRMGDTSQGAGPSGNTIGGTLPGAGNLISGNFDNGIEVAGATTVDNVIAGNLIGTSRSGNSAIFNTRGIGIINAARNRIGGATAAARNVISGSDDAGIRIDGAQAVENRVQGNYIGTTINGRSPLPNSAGGILVINGASRNIIGAAPESRDPNEGNVIAFNGSDGVIIRTGTRNTVRLNSIHSNAALGIDLDDDEQTLNDPGDGDAGGNGRQNWPEIVRLSAPAAGPARVLGYFDGKPFASYTFDFYANDGNTTSSLGEGGQYLSSEFLTPGLDGHVQFSYVLPLTAPLGKFVTVTATDAEGNTSEFSHDADTDGLYDHWESGTGIDGNNDGLPDYYLGAPDPLHKDVYVDVDDIGTINSNIGGQVVAYALAHYAPARSVLNPDGRAGITLHFERDPVPAPQRTLSNMAQLRDMKQTEFGTGFERSAGPGVLAAKRLTHRYAVFGPPNTDHGGLAWVYGHELYVSLGNDRHIDLAAAFMHELGHSMGLDHGGGDGVQNKPNYHSIMNYLWSYRPYTPDQLSAGRPNEANFAASWSLDYSKTAFPTLDENNLDERVGIRGHTGEATKAGPPEGRFVWESGPVDWNQDGDTNDVITSGIDLNRLTTDDGDTGDGTVLVGYDDWSNLILNFRHSNVYRSEFPSGIPSLAAVAGGEADAEPGGDLPPDLMDALADVGYDNGAPRVRGLSDRVVDEGQTVSFSVPATDPENDPLTFTLAPGAPAGARIDPATGLFTWQTDEQDGYGMYVITVLITDAGSRRTREGRYGIIVNGVDDAIVARRLFYNRSVWDTTAPGPAAAADDYAVAEDKRALLSGEPATYANLSNYSRGINGIMIDFAALPDGVGPTAADFRLEIGGGTSWNAANVIPVVTVRRGAGVRESDRVVLTLPDGAIKNTWLRVTVNASLATGLAQPDVFVFGSLVGETGDAASPRRVSAMDILAIRRHASDAGATYDAQFDINQDGKVNSLDSAAARTSLLRTIRPVTAEGLVMGQVATAGLVTTLRRVWDESPSDVLA